MADANSPSRNDDLTMACPICGGAFHPVGRQRVCSPACRQTLWRGFAGYRSSKKAPGMAGPQTKSLKEEQYSASDMHIPRT